MTSQELYELLELPREVIGMLNSMSPDDLPPVSYTHLTLPTKA